MVRRNTVNIEKVCSIHTLPAILLLFVVGCGKQHYVDPAIQPYINSFVQAGMKHNKFFDETSSAVFVEGQVDPSDKEAIGVCNPELNTILISKSYFYSVDNFGQENIIWHELGHCLLHRLHRTTLNNFNQPVSIMYPRMLQPIDYQTRHDDLEQELFEFSNEF